MPRKTTTVESLRYIYDNACLSKPELYVMNVGREAAALEELNQDLRGMSRMLEDVLHDTGNYKGFHYIDRKGSWCGLDHPDFYEYRRKYH